MGALHPVEQYLTLLLAFGPFVVLGLVIWRRSREHAVEDPVEDEVEDEVGHAGQDAGGRADEKAQRG